MNKRIVADIFWGETSIFLDENIIKAEVECLDRGDLTNTLEWGIYANKGFISFIDTSGWFNRENINLYEIKKAQVIFYICKNTKQRIATFNIESVEFDDKIKKVDLNLVSKLITWQTKKTSERIYPFYDTSVKELLRIVNSRFNVNIQESSDFKGDKIIINCPYIEPSNLWDIVNQLCISSMSRIVEDEYGNAIITNGISESEPIIVNPNNIISISNQGFFSIVNSSITYKKINIISKKSTQQTTKNFNLNWTQVLPPPPYPDYTLSSSDNIQLTLGDVYPNPFDPSHSYVLAWGSCTFTTPHKIFNIYEEKTYVDKKTISYTGEETIENNIETLFFEKKEIVGDSNILCETAGFIIEDIYNDASGFPISNKLTTRIETRIAINGFDDVGYGEYKKINSNYPDEPIVKIPTSDLIREKSKYLNDDGSSIKLFTYISDEVSRLYEKGIEYFEIECLFNDYYDETGNIIFEKNDLSNHFSKYDIIIPYIVRKGQKVPLRKSENGEPKKYRVVGISYLYDGLLTQKLYVQEER